MTHRAERCESCAYAVAREAPAYLPASLYAEEPPLKVYFACHRFPPRAAGFPSMDAADWCGEWKLA